MGNRQFTNNATTTLASSISAAATSLAVAGGTGVLFPAISGTQFFTATLVKANTPTVWEIFICTERAGDNFTAIQRAQEGTTALAWNAGDTVALFPTAADLNGLAQSTDVQAQAGNFALDTGAANAYSVVLTPALTAHVEGMPIRWLAGHTNTGGSTFNDGVGIASILTPEGAALMAGEVTAGGIYTAFWDGAHFQLGGVHAISFSQLVGSIANGQVPVSAVTQYLTTILANAALTGSPSAPTPPAGDADTSIATTLFVNPGTSLAVDGYRKNSDKTIDQWGQIAYSGSGATVAVTFPTPFLVECFNVQCTCSVSGFNAGASGLGTNGYTMQTSQLEGTAMTIYWRAVGQ